MSGQYAKGTLVSVEKSKLEIEKTVTKYGATAFSSAWKDSDAQIEFMIGGRHIRMTMSLPKKENYYECSNGRVRTEENAYKAWEQGCRSIWRSLSFIIKAKLVAVDDGISSFDREFMADIMMPDGKTIAEHTLDKIEAVYSGEKVKGLLPEFSG